METIMKYQKTPIRMAKNKRLTIPSFVEEEKEWNLLYIIGRNIKLCIWNTFWQFLKKLNINLPCDLDIQLLGIYPKGIKAYVQIKTCTKIFIAVLFVIVKY